MFKKHLLQILWLFAFGVIVQANNPPATILPPNVSEAFQGCNEPAPSDFHVEALGSTSVKLRWTVNAIASQHRIRTYKSAGNILISTDVVAAGQETLTVLGLSEQETYYSVINAVCLNGYHSPYVDTVPDYTTITDELIVSGFTPLSNPAVDCSIYPTDDKDNPDKDRCSITETLTTFRIIDLANPSNERQFQIDKLSNTSFDVELHTDNVNTQSLPIYYTIRVNGNDPTTELGGLFEIETLNEVLVATFRIYNSDAEGTILHRESLLDGYHIEKIKASGNRPAAPTKPRRFQHATSLAASPNPFSDQLELFLSQTALHPVRVQLNNLAGQTVLDQQFPAGQDQYTLSTEKLQPGFYLLRIEADGEVQTLKVIKSE